MRHAAQVQTVSRQRILVPVRMQKASRKHRTRTWARRHRTWLVMVMMLSVLGSGGALVGGWLGKAFYSYNPSFYEPKDTEREEYLNRLARERAPQK